MAVRVAINGFGRIGRLAFREMFGKKDFEIVAINDLTDARQLAYLLKYDSSQGRYKKEVSFEEGLLVVEGSKIPVFAQKNPAELPWKDYKVDVVLECTGFFYFTRQSFITYSSGSEKSHHQCSSKRKRYSDCRIWSK